MPQASLFLDILNAVKSVIDTLSLTDWNSNAVPTIVRKTAAYRQQVDASYRPPTIFISPSHKGEQIKLLTFGDYIHPIYSVDVFTVAAGNQDLNVHIDYYLSWRQTLRRAFQGPTLSGVSAVWDTNMKPGSALDEATISKNYDVLLLTIEFQTSEQRLTT